MQNDSKYAPQKSCSKSDKNWGQEKGRNELIVVDDEEKLTRSVAVGIDSAKGYFGRLTL
jgi:hypothetical protein